MAQTACDLNRVTIESLIELKQRVDELSLVASALTQRRRWTVVGAELPKSPICGATLASSVVHTAMYCAVLCVEASAASGCAQAEPTEEAL